MLNINKVALLSTSMAYLVEICLKKPCCVFDSPARAIACNADLAGPSDGPDTIRDARLDQHVVHFYVHCAAEMFDACWLSGSTLDEQNNYSAHRRSRRVVVDTP